jgi:hypothetical protein
MLNVQELRARMIEAIRLTGTVIENDQLEIFDRGIPHKPSGLPKGKRGIYVYLSGVFPENRSSWSKW